MARRIVRIAPWQAGKVAAVLYFIMGLVLAGFMALAIVFAPPNPAPGRGRRRGGSWWPRLSCMRCSDSCLFPRRAGSTTRWLPGWAGSRSRSRSRELRARGVSLDRVMVALLRIDMGGFRRNGNEADPSCEKARALRDGW